LSASVAKSNGAASNLSKLLSALANLTPRQTLAIKQDFARGNRRDSVPGVAGVYEHTGWRGSRRDTLLSNATDVFTVDPFIGEIAGAAAININAKRRAGAIALRDTI